MGAGARNRRTEGSGRFVCQSSCKKREGSRNPQVTQVTQVVVEEEPLPRSSEGADEVGLSQPEAGSCGRAEGGGSLIGMGNGTGFAGVTGVLEYQGLQPGQQHCLRATEPPRSPNTSPAVVRTLCAVCSELSAMCVPCSGCSRAAGQQDGGAGVRV